MTCEAWCHVCKLQVYRLRDKTRHVLGHVCATDVCLEVSQDTRQDTCLDEV